MNPLRALARLVGMAPDPQPDPQPPVAPIAVVREAAGMTVDADEDDWRRLTGDSRRDLSPVTQRRMREMAYYVWEANLLANRLVELPIAYLLAEGVTLESSDPDVQPWLDAFWHDPINVMDLSLPRRMRLLALNGEACWPVFVNEFNGHVRLGTLDPSQIKTVVFDPDNSEQPIGIVTCRDKKGGQRRYRIIVIGPEEVFGKTARRIRETFTDGDCFYFRINDLGRRGRSDLLAQVDWVDAYEQFLFGEIDRAQFLRAFMWDVTLTGATVDEVAARAKQITAPRPGSVRVHNDSEEWKAVTPEIQATDGDAAARTFRTHVLGGATLPEHWYGAGGDVNRATASEMGDPTYKILLMRQQVWKHILEQIGAFVVWRRVDPSGQSAPDPSDPDTAYQVRAVFPELVSRDLSKFTTALAQIVTAVAAAVDAGLMTDELALRHVQAISAMLGIEYDVEAELAKARAATAARREEDMFRDPPDLPDPRELAGPGEDEDPAAAE